MSAREYLQESFLGTVTVGERGQIVIPAEARKRFDIQTGEKLLMMNHPSGDGLVLFKVDALREFLDHLAAGLSIAEADEDSAGSG